MQYDALAALLICLLIEFTSGPASLVLGIIWVFFRIGLLLYLRTSQRTMTRFMMSPRANGPRERARAAGAISLGGSRTAR